MQNMENAKHMNNSLFKQRNLSDHDFQTLYESSTALGFKRSMHIEEGKEVAVSFDSFSLCLHKILTFHIKSGASATCEATGGRQGELRKTSEL